MTIYYLDSVDSTQLHLKKLIKNKEIEVPCAVVCDIQTDGLGSRGSKWIGIKGNLLVSFALNIKDLPLDLKLESISIYFAYILKETLAEYGSKAWLKWPNDFYIDSLKFGGLMTNIVDNVIICGLGINLKKSPKNFTVLDIEISKRNLLETYFKNIKKSTSWKKIFSQYKIEFYKYKNYFIKNNGINVSIDDAILQEDGSIIYKNERIYSQR